MFTQESESGNIDIVMMTVADRSVRPLVHTAAIQANARVSADGKWLAYQSNESAADQVYIQAFPNATQR